MVGVVAVVDIVGVAFVVVILLLTLSLLLVLFSVSHFPQHRSFCDVRQILSLAYIE